MRDLLPPLEVSPAYGFIVVFLAAVFVALFCWTYSSKRRAWCDRNAMIPFDDSEEFNGTGNLDNKR